MFVAVSRITGGVLFGTTVTIYLGRASSPLVHRLLSLLSLGLFLFAPVWGTLV